TASEGVALGCPPAHRSFRHPPASRAATQTGGPSGARERDRVESAGCGDHRASLRNPCFAAVAAPLGSGSPLRCARNDEREELRAQTKKGRWSDPPAFSVCV